MFQRLGKQGAVRGLAFFQELQCALQTGVLNVGTELEVDLTGALLGGDVRRQVGHYITGRLNIRSGKWCPRRVGDQRSNAA